MRLGLPDDCTCNNHSDVIQRIAHDMNQDAHDAEISLLAASGCISRLVAVIVVQTHVLLSRLEVESAFLRRRTRYGLPIVDGGHGLPRS